MHTCTFQSGQAWSDKDVVLTLHKVQNQIGNNVVVGKLVFSCVKRSVHTSKNSPPSHRDVFKATKSLHVMECVFYAS